MLELKYCNISNRRFSLSVPYFEIKGISDGPTVFISAGMHGDEINGIFLVRKFLEWAEQSKLESTLKGRLFVLPVLNLSGFGLGKRYVAEDGKDLNRQFGKNSEESFSALIANGLLEEILSKCDMGIDFHDAGSGAVLLPHARIHITDKDECVSCSRALARVLGTQFILERRGFPSMMAVYMNNQLDKPVITVEIGGAKQLHSELIEIGMKCIRNFLITNNMIAGELIIPECQYILHSRTTIRASYSAIIQFKHKLGEWVEDGQEIASLYNPETARIEPLLATKAGVLFSVWPSNQVRKGVQICSIVNTRSRNMASEGLVKMENYHKTV